MTAPDFWHVIWPTFWFGVGGAWLGYWSCVWIQHRITQRRYRKYAAQNQAAADRHSINLPPYRTTRTTHEMDVARNRRNLHIHTGFDYDD